MSIETKEGYDVSVTAFLLSFIVFIVSFNKHFFDSSKVLIDLGFDGFKNYYTFGYYVRHGGGLHFDGMAYPNGDSILFADAQPIIAFILSHCGVLFPWVHENTSLVVNILMAMGFGLGAFFIVKILRDSGLGRTSSLLLSIGIVFLSPQLFRLSLHHSLSYPFVIPSVIWFFILMRRGDLNKPMFGLWILVVGLIHIYYVLMCLMWFGGFYALEFLRHKKVKYKEFLSFVAPAIALFVFVQLSSIGLDRPEAPWGLFNFSGGFTDLFLPHTGKLATYLSEANITLKTNYNEASSYIGVVGILGLVSIVINQAIRFKKEGITLHTQVVLALIPVLMFGAQWPMSYFSEELIQSLPIIGQFRGTGRFFWLAYYVITLYGVISIRSLLAYFGPKWLASAVIILCSLLMLFEASGHVKNRIDVQNKYAGPDVFKDNTWISQALADTGLQRKEYQAIITIPPSTTGSEKLWLYDNFHVKMVAWPYSWQTGTPMTAINLSRTPIQTTLESLAITCNEYHDHPGLSKLDEGDFLIVILNDIKKNYTRLINKSQLIKEGDKVSLYQTSSKGLRTQEKTTPSHNDSLPLYSGTESSIIDSYKDKDAKGLRGSALMVNGFSEWKSYPLDSSLYSCVNLSFWNRITAGPGEVVILNLRFLDKQENIIHEASRREFDAARFEVFDNWVQMQHILDVPPNTNEVSVQFQGTNLLLDELSMGPCLTK